MSTPTNRFSNLLALAVPAAGLMTCVTSNGAVDMYLKFDGIEGESVARGFEKHVEILSWSWGASNAGASAGGGTGAGKVSMQDFHFTCKVNSASPPLLLACAAGQHIPSATFSFTRPSSSPTAGPETYYVVTLSDVTVSRFSSSRPAPTATTSTTDFAPVERITLNFTKIEFRYTPAAVAGSTGGNPVTATVAVAP